MTNEDCTIGWKCSHERCVKLSCDGRAKRIWKPVRVVVVFFATLMTDGSKDLYARLEFVMLFMQKFEVCIRFGASLK
ncbi:hypothetical protein MTR_1g018450 [Medicago truncatula]|uniref:Uncharacterized protein n=1 Tax=Medicago truncatula TaxID=3880 RepID=G7ICE8_MEDTR|nr:hypothetical protein MTR_1g018450 [Medicago truncatula]